MNTEDLLWRINQLYDQYSGEASFWERIAKEITEETGERFTKDMVRGRWRRAQSDECPQGEKLPQSDLPPDLTINTDGVSSVDELIEKSGIDRNVFDVERFILNVWDGKEQVKVWLKRKTAEPFSEEEFLNKISDVVQNHLKNIPHPVKDTEPQFRTEQKEYLFIPVIFDAHVDSPKSRADYIGVLRQLMKLGTDSGYRPSRILYIIGNDFGHIDNEKYTTTGGTLVGSTRTYLDSVDERCSLLLKAADFLRNSTPALDIIGIPGNHDRFSTYWLSRVLDAYYRKDLNANVYNGQSPRKYYRYGRTLFGLTHGNEENAYDMASLMAVEAPLDWAASENRIWLTGHLHQQRRTYNMLTERYGVIQRIFPSLVEPDDWHILKGYIGMDVAAQLLIYDLDGPIAEFHLSVR